MQYGLNISIDSPAVEEILIAHKNITLVKSVVTSPLPSDNWPVVWIILRPFERNSVVWIENYNIYATTTDVYPFETIQQTSVTGTPVELGRTYTFAHGQFTGAPGGGSTYNVSNQQGGMLGFGLSQQAMVNGTPVNAPLNAVPVLNNESASFAPGESVSIFLSDEVENGVVLRRVASNALVVTLTPQKPTADIGLTDCTIGFVLMP